MQNKLQKAFENTALHCIVDTVPRMPDHTFSKGFEKKMNRLIKNGKPVKMRRISPKKMYICVIAAIIAACLMTLSVGAARDFFKKFFMEIFNTHTTVQSSDYENAPTSIETVYTIDIPDNFELTYKDELFDWSPYISYNYYDDNDYIFFTQNIKSKYDVNVNTENHLLEYIEIKGNDGYIIDLGNDEYLITWDNGDYIFDITGSIGKNQLIKLAESVQKVE